jgi:hypothetical protein
MMRRLAVNGHHTPRCDRRKLIVDEPAVKNQKFNLLRRLNF